ncbi:hypothetical protein WCLP8_1380002 [uncultured Gammaproteobacteria bacterium]
MVAWFGIRAVFQLEQMDQNLHHQTFDLGQDLVAHILDLFGQMLQIDIGQIDAQRRHPAQGRSLLLSPGIEIGFIGCGEHGRIPQNSCAPSSGGSVPQAWGAADQNLLLAKFSAEVIFTPVPEAGVLRLPFSSLRPIIKAVSVRTARVATADGSLATAPKFRSAKF